MSRTLHLQRWSIIHRWTSLICTLFLFVICLTGLPLVFSEEIDQWLEPTVYAVLPVDAPRANLDQLAQVGQRMYPGQVITSFFIDDDEPQVYLWMAPSFAVAKENPKTQHFIRFDARTAQVLETSKSMAEQPLTFMGVMLHLHADLFADLPGELFMGLMALLFVIAIVSGVVLYAPFMRKLEFGAVRQGRGPRLAWLDIHNLLGIVTLMWALVIGITGVMNELSTPLFAIWQRTDVKAMLAPWQGQSTPDQTALSSAQGALETARRAVPKTTFTGVTYPGDNEGSPYHYLLWGHGNTPLTSRLFTPVLVDARTGELTAIVHMPWYLRLLEVSRPLHFGDYGSSPLKIIWALLDVVTIAVLGSGLYLWLARRKTRSERFARLIKAHASGCDVATKQ
jgi:uncharacterized iron-regulated membrane protein